MIEQVNINSLRNKFHSRNQHVTGNIDMLMVQETTLESSYPVGLLSIDSYSRSWLWEQKGMYTAFCLRKYPCKLLFIEDQHFYVETNLRIKNMTALFLFQLKWKKHWNLTNKVEPKFSFIIITLQKFHHYSKLRLGCKWKSFTSF